MAQSLCSGGSYALLAHFVGVGSTMEIVLAWRQFLLWFRRPFFRHMARGEGQDNCT